MVDSRDDAPLADELVQALARSATGRPDAVVARWQLTPTEHPVENMTTHQLARLTGTLDDGTSWSVFAKTLHPASDSPLWQFVPEEFHHQVLQELDWLDEPRIYRSPLTAQLPRGLRMPTVFDIDQSTDRITIWMEDVGGDDCWDLDRYRRASVVLGRLAGRWPEDQASQELGLGRRPIDGLFFGKISHVDLPLLADDGFWRESGVAAAADPSLRADLARLAHDTPRLLKRFAALPHGMAHGDAAPDNLREPGDGTVVAIDWSYGASAPIGSDLAQLLAGRSESGQLDPAELGTIADVIVEGFIDGLADEGIEPDRAAVEEAWGIHLAVRSVFSALVLDHVADLPEADRHELLVRRAGLARFGIDLVDRVGIRS